MKVTDIKVQARGMFYPKILTTLKTYSAEAFLKDISAGIIVGIVALPLAIAFGIASGVSPEQGILTAIIAGFLISLFGGSRVQIGGPTGAFIVIVYGIIQQYGIMGLTIATFMSGVILIIMGLTKMGNLIRFIPSPVIVGFTSGIALVIFSSQVRDILGLQMETVPADFLEKWQAYGTVLDTVNYWALGIALATIGIIIALGYVMPKLPGAFIALVITTCAASFLNLPIETIGSRFGEVEAKLVIPDLSGVDLNTIRHLAGPAFTIAILAAIESLLSAVVADSMIGGKHRSNTELIAQGIANIFSPLFGGIPATGAIARTATNIKNGGRTPIAGIIHALTLLSIMLFAGSLASYIPMATLAGILVIVSYNMSEWRKFRDLLSTPKSDVAVLLTTFSLTVIFDLVIAIQVGMVMAAFMFMNRMAAVSNISLTRTLIKRDESDAASYYSRPDALENIEIPAGIKVFEVHGAFFFGAASKFEEIIKRVGEGANSIILRMNNMSMIDASGLQILYKLAAETKKKNCRLILTELDFLPLKIRNQLTQSESFGKENVFKTLEEALVSLDKEFLKQAG